MDKIIQELIGKSEKQATRILKSKKIKYRIIQRDGTAYVVTSDFLPDRLNLVFESGIVTKVTVG